MMVDITNETSVNPHTVTNTCLNGIGGEGWRPITFFLIVDVTKVNSGNATISARSVTKVIFDR